MDLSGALSIMNERRRRVEELLWAVGAHEIARSLYRVTVGRKATKLRAAMTSFYRQLIPSGALVFDIGANLGGFARIFEELGTQVVAVEPNADCVRHMHLSYSSRQIEVIQALAGPCNGLAVVNISDRRDDISSVSDEWIAAMEREQSSIRGAWSRKLTVPMVTLDTLIHHYGAPHFIKIDVEGFEQPVLNGLSVQPPLLSFEFNRACLGAAFGCADHAVFADGSLFNFAFGDPVRFELRDWVDKAELKERLANVSRRDAYGDVFVRASVSS